MIGWEQLQAAQVDGNLTESRSDPFRWCVTGLYRIETVTKATGILIKGLLKIRLLDRDISKIWDALESLASYTSLLTASLASGFPVASCSRCARRAAFSALMRSSSWRTEAWLVGMSLLRAVLSSEGNIRSLY